MENTMNKKEIINYLNSLNEDDDIFKQIKYYLEMKNKKIPSEIHPINFIKIYK